VLEDELVSEGEECNARASSEKRNTRERSEPQGAVRNRQSGRFI
jgi:hypothetical protein